MLVIGFTDIPIGNDSTAIVFEIKCDAGKSFLSTSNPTVLIKIRDSIIIETRIIIFLSY